MGVQTYTIVLLFGERATTARKAEKNLLKRLKRMQATPILVEPEFVQRFLTLGYPHGTKLVDGQEPPNNVTIKRKRGKT